MKRKLTQTATRTITLSREIIVEFPADVDPDLIDSDALDSALAKADVEWEADDEDFEMDDTDWSVAHDDDEPDLIYGE